jgi:hypothetical protein
LANHLADVHELSSQERQPYLIRAQPTVLAPGHVLKELYRLIGNSKKQSKWNKSGIKNTPIRQPKSSRKRKKSNTKSAKNMDNTEMNDGSKECLKLETRTGQNSYVDYIIFIQTRIINFVVLK